MQKAKDVEGVHTGFLVWEGAGGGGGEERLLLTR